MEPQNPLSGPLTFGPTITNVYQVHDVDVLSSALKSDTLTEADSRQCQWLSPSHCNNHSTPENSFRIPLDRMLKVNCVCPSQALVHVSDLMSTGRYHRMVGVVSQEVSPTFHFTFLC